MAKQRSNNWLEPFRIKAKFSSRYALSKAVNKCEKTIGRWENYKTLNNIPYDKLAKALQTDQQTLKEAHQQGIARDKNEKKILSRSLIVKALEDCSTMALTRHVLIKLETPTIESAADKIVDWLKEGNIKPFTKNFNQLIRTAIDTVDLNTITDLGLIEQLVGHIALSAILPQGKDRFDKNQTFTLSGVKKAWSIRLMIDASIGFSMTGITAQSSTALKSVGGVKIEETTKDTVWQAAYEIIKNLADELFMEQESFPELVESEGHQALPEEDQYPDFRKYCSERMNPAIEQTNYMEMHSFLFSSLENEPKDVQQRVLMLLKDVRVFIFTENHPKACILRLNEQSLEAWIATSLYAIQNRREQLKSLEVSKMETKDNTDKRVYVIDGGEGGVTFAAAEGGSTITQTTHSPESEQLIALLNEILKATDRSIPEHQQLRGDLNEILNPLNKKEMPPEQGKSWLKDGLGKLKLMANLKTGTGLITLLEKAIKLYEKV